MLAFLQDVRVVRPFVLCGNQLTWVKSCKHLGNTIVTNAGGDIRNQDVKNKRADFIDNTNDIIQGFSFAYPKTRAEVNVCPPTSSAHARSVGGLETQCGV
jgi:hypothetical protein